MRRHLIRTLGLAAALALALAGCGGADEDAQVATAGGGGSGGAAATSTGAQPAADSEERRRQFTACMRENGIEMRDVEPGGGPAKIERADRVDQQKMEAAMKACRSLMPDGGEPPKLSPEDLEKARAMAACMREHGINMPDPDPDQGGALMVPLGEGEPEPDLEKMDKALEACRHLGPQLEVPQ